MDNESIIEFDLGIKGLQGLTTTELCLKITDELKKGNKVLLPKINWRIIGYETEYSAVMGMKFVFKIMPDDDIKLDDLFPKITLQSNCNEEDNNV